jgi:orotidine-5'-phosphate decarboxylase
MVRYGDQEKSSPGGAQRPLKAAKAPAARSLGEPARRDGASAQDPPQDGEARLAEQDDTRGPHPRQAPPRRAFLLRRPESLRAIPSLARFLAQGSAKPGDAPPPGPPGGQEAAEAAAAGEAGQDAGTDLDSGAGPRPPESGGAAVPADVPESSAAELRELAELSDLLTELAGLVHDLGALIIGLMTAATGAGGRQARTFTIPPELAELAVAHQELKAEQQALNARFLAAGSHQERAALRGSLAALTERATRAVSAAAAAVTPQEVLASGRPSGGTAPQGESGPQSREPLREETGVPSTTGGTPPRGPVRWRDASASDRRLAPVAVALDAPDIDVAAHWATLVTPYVSTVKIGLELYLRYGPAVVATVRGGSGVQVFLDLKLHDIPNTVAGAARAVSKLHPEILTVHAAGGADMIKAAVQAAPDAIVAGVTLLTSICDKDLAALGMDGSVSDAVRRMAELAVSAGAPDILLITPGIRPAGATSDDQARIATPEEALKAGADLLVIGRPITKAADPGAAAAAIAGSLRRAVPATLSSLPSRQRNPVRRPGEVIAPRRSRYVIPRAVPAR